MSRIFGVGTDIMNIERIADSSLAKGDPFLRMTYSEKEIREAERRKNSKLFYGTRYAGKEAVFKALRTDPERILFNEIEILDDEYGAPYVVLRGSIAKIAERRDVTAVHISLSYDGDTVVACAAAEQN